MVGGDLAGAQGRGLGPDVQGQHRRPARLARRSRSCGAWSPPGPRSRPTTPRSPRSCPSCPRSTSPATPSRPAPGRRRPGRAHRVGRLQVGRPRRGRRRPWAAAGSSTPATCSTGRSCSGAGSSTTASVGTDAWPESSSPGAPASSGRTSVTPCSAGVTRSSCVDNLVTGTHDQHRAPLRPRAASPSSTTTSASTSGCPGRSTPSSTSPARRRPIDYLELPIQTLKVGSLGTHNALGLARAKGARFMLASTSEVYGDPTVHPQPETYWGNVNPIGPRGVYDEAKRFAEAITMAYHRTHELEVRIVRIFNTYGPRMRARDGRVVSNFIVQALEGEPLTIYGDGTQTRSFCFVDDEVARASWRCSTATTPGRSTSATTASSPCSSWPRSCSRSPARRRRIEHRPLPVDDPKQRRPDSPSPGACWAGSRRSTSARASPAPPSTSGQRAGGRAGLSRPPARRRGQTGRASASSRWARYQSRVEPQALVERGAGHEAEALAGPCRRRRRGGAGRRAWWCPTGPRPRSPTSFTMISTRSRIGQLAVGAEVDRLGVVVALGGQHDALGGVVDVEELPAGRARAPHLDVVGAALLGVDRLLDQRRDDVGDRRVELVAGARRGWWASGRSALWPYWSRLAWSCTSWASLAMPYGALVSSG